MTRRRRGEPASDGARDRAGRRASRDSLPPQGGTSARTTAARVAACVALLGCLAAPIESPAADAVAVPPAHGGTMSFTIESPAFAANGEIPSKYTCEGDDVSPPLRWSGVPPSAKSLALVVDDPDAPDPRAPQRVWVHWVVYDLPPSTQALAEGAKGAELPPTAKVGKNDWGRAAWGGPCPPIGRHRYFFKLYALDTALPELRAPTKAALEDAMQGHVVGEAQLVGTYEKRKK
jgi:Raf kinase inhibitor-like YbhB/YbcL family protein